MSINDYPQGGFNALIRERAIDMAVKRVFSNEELKNMKSQFYFYPLVNARLLWCADTQNKFNNVRKEFRKIMVK